MTYGISQQTIDVQIERNGHMQAKATALITAPRRRRGGPAARALSHAAGYRRLGCEGEALDFIQEDKLHDPDFAVLLERPLSKGESIAITMAYGGKEAVEDLGGGNYLVNGGARESWYPNVRGAFGNYAHYRLTFHTPKTWRWWRRATACAMCRMASCGSASGRPSRLSPWRASNLGRFKTQHSERNPTLQVASYANEEVSDRVGSLANSGAILGGGMGTAGMLARATSEGDAAVQIYTEEFGPLE